MTDGASFTADFVAQWSRRTFPMSNRTLAAILSLLYVSAGSIAAAQEPAPAQEPAAAQEVGPAATAPPPPGPPPQAPPTAAGDREEPVRPRRPVVRSNGGDPYGRPPQIGRASCRER